MKEGWKMVKFLDVAQIIGGSTPKTNVKSYWNGNYYWVTPAELKGNKYIYKTERTITDEAIQKSNLTLLPKGTVLLSSRAPIGKVCITQVPMYCNQGFKNIVCSDVLYNEYVYYYLLYSVPYLESLGTGATFKEISKRVVEGVEIPLPPLEEQHRIVGILDAAFEKIDALKANAEANLKNAKALFQQVLSQELQPKEGWVEKKLGDISKDIFAGGDAPKENMSKTITEHYKIPIFANAVEDDGLYGFTDNARVNEPAITIAARGSGTGYVLRRKVPFLPIVRLIVVLPKEFVDINYIYYALKNMTIRKTGSAIPQLTVPMIRKYIINYPINISEQHRIVATLDTLSEKCRRLEQVAQQTIAECDALKQSILRQAFSGEL